MTGRGRIELVGCGFDRMTMESALARCLEWCAGPRASHTVVPMNAALLCMMRHDPEFSAACRNGDLLIPDGMPVVWTARLAGVPLPERVPGIDLMSRLLRAGSERGLRAYFLGARPQVLEELLRRCGRDYPGLVLAGSRDGYFGPDQHEAVVAAIREARPHLLFVGMPSPFKEVFVARHREALDVPVIMAVGGSFDVLAGYLTRAPRPLQSIGMEWAWRLAMEPRKMWKRYLLANSEYLWLAGREILRRRAGLGK